MKKYRIQGKTYTVTEDLPNDDITLIKFICKVIDSKKQEYVLIKSVKGYTLYKEGKVFTKTYSIKEL
jgi:hypothetical protein